MSSCGSRGGSSGCCIKNKNYDEVFATLHKSFGARIVVMVVGDVVDSHGFSLGGIIFSVLIKCHYAVSDI